VADHAEFHCAEVQELLPWAMNGSLDVAVATGIRAHLRTCADCRQGWMETLWTFGVYGLDRSEGDATLGMRHAVIRRPHRGVARERQGGFSSVKSVRMRRRPGWGLRWRWTAAATLACVLGIVVLVSWHGRQSPAVGGTHPDRVSNLGRNERPRKLLFRNGFERRGTSAWSESARTPSPGRRHS